MTREEAIKWFRESTLYHKDHEPFNMAIKALEQEPCEDAISRQYLIDIATHNGVYDDISLCDIRNAPSVIPSRPTGHWIRDTITDLYHCSCCRTIVRQDPKNKDDYCRHCGASMESEEQA